MQWMTSRHHRSWPGVGDSDGAGDGLVADESRKPQVPELKVERYTLPNGLTVLLHEDHKTPVRPSTSSTRSAPRMRSRAGPALPTSSST